jgi:3-oxoacyl-[acyl-carrier protein] reductase
MAGRDSILAGRSAIVTGAGRGIGRAFALRLASLGAAVTVADLDLAGAVRAGEAKLDVVAEIEASGGRAAGVETDVTDKAAVEAMVATAMDRFGGVDILICNAGSLTGMEDSFAATVSEQSLRGTFETNFFGTVNCCRAAAPHLREGGWGRVVNMSSLAALRPLAGGVGAPYVAAKAAIIGYTLALAEELGADGVTVNAIAPGSIDTPLTRGLFSDMDDASAHAQLPLRRFGTPEDVAGVGEFLCTPLSDYVTGQVICVDGGMSITDALHDSGLG